MNSEEVKMMEQMLRLLKEIQQEQISMRAEIQDLAFRQSKFEHSVNNRFNEVNERFNEVNHKLDNIAAVQESQKGSISFLTHSNETLRDDSALFSRTLQKQRQDIEQIKEELRRNL